MRKFGTNEGEDYSARFYEKAGHQVMQAEIHDKNRKLTLKTFNQDLNNPKYNLLTYELCEKKQLKFDPSKFDDVTKHAKKFKMSKIVQRLVAQQPEEFAELGLIDKMTNIDNKEAAVEKIRARFM